MTDGRPSISALDGEGKRQDFESKRSVLLQTAVPPPPPPLLLLVLLSPERPRSLSVSV